MSYKVVVKSLIDGHRVKEVTYDSANVAIENGHYYAETFGLFYDVFVVFVKLNGDEMLYGGYYWKSKVFACDVNWSDGWGFYYVEVGY